MPSQKRLNRGIFAFATTIVVIAAIMGIASTLTYPQAGFGLGVMSGAVVFHAGGPPSPAADCHNETTMLAPGETGPIVIVAQAESSPASSIDIPIHWTSDCVLGARFAYGSIQDNLPPGNYMVYLDCPDGSPITPPDCGDFVNQSLVITTSGETYQLQGNTLPMQILVNRTTTLNVDISSTIY